MLWLTSSAQGRSTAWCGAPTRSADANSADNEGEHSRFARSRNTCGTRFAKTKKPLSEMHQRLAKMASTPSVVKLTTASRLAKTKKPLSEMHQLQRAVKELQRDAAEQLVLEVESQATFEFLTSQLRALRSAFDTLSDVLLNEIDGVRKETQRRLGDLDALVTRQVELHKASHAEVAQLQRAMELWALKERDWAKDNEILKASHVHNIEWMQQLQRDVIDVKDRAHEFRADVAVRLTSACDDAANLRVHWQKQADDVAARLQDFDAAASKQAAASRAQTQQRVDDMELMEQAFSTLQKQQLHVRTALEDHVQRGSAQHALVCKKMEVLESQSASQRAVLEQLRAKSSSLEKEQRRRMENVSKMFTVFAEALNLPPSAVGRIA